MYQNQHWVKEARGRGGGFGSEVEHLPNMLKYWVPSPDDTKQQWSTRCFSYCLVAMANIPDGQRKKRLQGFSPRVLGQHAVVVGESMGQKSCSVPFYRQEAEKGSTLVFSGLSLLYCVRSKLEVVLPAFRMRLSLWIKPPWNYPYRYSPRCLTSHLSVLIQPNWLKIDYFTR